MGWGRKKSTLSKVWIFPGGVSYLFSGSFAWEEGVRATAK